MEKDAVSDSGLDELLQEHGPPRTGAERDFLEFMGRPEYAAEYMEARRRLLRQQGLITHAFRLSPGRVCWVYLPWRLDHEGRERLKAVLTDLAPHMDEER